MISWLFNKMFKVLNRMMESMEHGILDALVSWPEDDED